MDEFARFYLYGLHGLLAEIIFTSLSDETAKLRGTTSIWSFFIYAIALHYIERIYISLKKFPICIRGLVYTLWILLWEFISGSALSLFHACPWDYSDHKYNFMGMITLEYIPLWAISSLLAEQFLIKRLTKK
jgi:uncharacterized membrane protein